MNILLIDTDYTLNVVDGVPQQFLVNGAVAKYVFNQDGVDINLGFYGPFPPEGPFVPHSNGVLKMGGKNVTGVHTFVFPGTYLMNVNPIETGAVKFSFRKWLWYDYVLALFYYPFRKSLV